MVQPFLTAAHKVFGHSLRKLMSCPITSVHRLLLAGSWFGPHKLAPWAHFSCLSFKQWMNCPLLVYIASGKQQKCTQGHVLRTTSQGVNSSERKFNGRHRCSWCEMPGQVAARGNGDCRVYPAPSLCQRHVLRNHSITCFKDHDKQ